MTALWQVSNDGKHWLGALSIDEGPESDWEPDIWRTAVLTKGRGSLLVKFWRCLPSVITPSCVACGRVYG